MTTKECFEILITKKGWYKELGIPVANAVNYVKSFKAGKLNTDKIELLLENAGFTIVHEKTWSPPFVVKKITIQEFQPGNYYSIWAEAISPDFDKAFLVEVQPDKVYLSLFKNDKETRIPFAKVEKVFARAFDSIHREQADFIRLYKKLVKDLVEPYKEIRSINKPLKVKERPAAVRRLTVFEEADLIYSFQGF
ncbi:MAG: hypothetical protein JWQ25_295 [Daejeonella sp.]|nr:hypothetical protein [Daejeonella sp.]